MLLSLFVLIPQDQAVASSYYDNSYYGYGTSAYLGASVSLDIYGGYSGYGGRGNSYGGGYYDSSYGCGYDCGCSYSGCSSSYYSGTQYTQPFQYYQYPQIMYVPNQTNNGGLTQPYQYQNFPQIVYVPNQGTANYNPYNSNTTATAGSLYYQAGNGQVNQGYSGYNYGNNYQYQYQNNNQYGSGGFIRTN